MVVVVVVVVLRGSGGFREVAWVGRKERRRGRSGRVEDGSMVLAWVEGGMRALRWVKCVL